jgi:hypothetical protein
MSFKSFWMLSLKMATKAIRTTRIRTSSIVPMPESSSHRDLRCVRNRFEREEKNNGGHKSIRDIECVKECKSESAAQKADGLGDSSNGTAGMDAYVVGAVAEKE